MEKGRGSLGSGMHTFPLRPEVGPPSEVRLPSGHPRLGFETGEKVRGPENTRVLRAATAAAANRVVRAPSWELERQFLASGCEAW